MLTPRRLSDSNGRTSATRRRPPCHLFHFIAFPILPKDTSRQSFPAGICVGAQRHLGKVVGHRALGLAAFVMAHPVRLGQLVDMDRLVPHFRLLTPQLCVKFLCRGDILGGSPGMGYPLL